MINGVRFLFAIMLCIANMIIYGCKTNIAVTIIGMAKVTQSDSGGSSECPQFESTNSTSPADSQTGDYDWTPYEQQLIQSIYFFGYLIGMFPAGYFANRFNTKWVLLLSVLSNAVLTMLVPGAASLNYHLLLTLRFITGLLSSANLPVVNVLVGKWVVYEEKSMWVGIIYAGTSLGTVISILSSGWIMEAWGWRWVYYIHGFLPLIWCLVFAIFFADCPEEQKLISEEERQLLVNTFGHRAPGTQKKSAVPWKAIWTSVPFWALLVTNTFGNFTWYFLLTQMPTFLSKMMKFKIKENVALSCTPYLLNAVVNSCVGKILDWGRRKGWWNQTGARKIAVAISCLPACLFLLGVSFIGCNREGATALLMICIITSGVIFIGHLTNQNDLAPNYAGILMGITNTPGTIAAVVMPQIVGWLTGSGHTFANWRIAFFINIACQAIAFCTFFFFGSAEIQNWNYPDGIPPAPVK